ncbi:unnamed protein product [Ilex paraguariensis]|uniref:Uncharacterized protein n=1 Tax=Ilex paraguariensis TaxID=185542 RepID=A0ABC8UAZ8_9AQUA
MGRTPCCDKNGLKKGPWTSEEDQKLIDYIQKNGYGNWRTLPKNAGLQRCGKSCRLRWTNYLRPDIKRGKLSFEEEETIIRLHSILGNKWSVIAAKLPGRTDNEIKNYWNTHIRKRLLRMGIDPVTHSPRLDLLGLSSIFNSSQINICRLLGVQPLVNQELIRVPTSLFSSEREDSHFFVQKKEQSNIQDSGHCKIWKESDAQFLTQKDQQNQLSNPPHVQNQFPPLLQPSQFQEKSTRTMLNTPYVQFHDETQLLQPNSEQFPVNCMQSTGNSQIDYPLFCFDHDTLPLESKIEQFSSTLTNFNNYQYCQLNEWQGHGIASNLTEDYGHEHNYSCYVSDQSAMDPPPSENSNFQSNNSHNFSFQSVLSTFSTPPSSPTPLNSNSTYTNSISTEDDHEREGHCCNMMKIQIPDVWDVNELL